MNGKTKFFNNRRGFGFITDAEGKDYFVHQSNIVMDGFRRLSEGQEVSFKVKESEKGLEAVEVYPM